ncbi:MAG: 3-keto-5-aminohexanoate cleavage protein [Rhodospirillales bacterium]|nr:3-keto-5-aminohexanoate cleavage protein [Rhodospirillales bacterium]
MQDLSPVIITVAPNGARRTKVDHPAIPLTPEELALCAEECMEAGASVIHLHVRDEQSKHSLDVGRYQEAIVAIREKIGDELVIQVTTEAVGHYTPHEQMEMVCNLQPEAVSLALKELIPDAQYEAGFSNFLKWLDIKGVASQFILYDEKDVELFASLNEKGIFRRSSDWVLFVLGKYQEGQGSDPRQLDTFLSIWNAKRQTHSWGFCAFGSEEINCALAGAVKGGHPRIGFENNLRRPDGVLLHSNGESVRTLSEALKSQNRVIASVKEARKAMGIA